MVAHSVDVTQGISSRDIAILAMAMITDDWWQEDESALRKWERAFLTDIDSKSWGNVAAFLLEYVRAALENMRGSTLGIGHEAENFHERTMNQQALEMRKVLFGR